MHKIMQRVTTRLLRLRHTIASPLLSASAPRRHLAVDPSLDDEIARQGFVESLKHIGAYDAKRHARMSTKDLADSLCQLLEERAEAVVPEAPALVDQPRMVKTPRVKLNAIAAMMDSMNEHIFREPSSSYVYRDSLAPRLNLLPGRDSRHITSSTPERRVYNYYHVDNPDEEDGHRYRYAR